MVPAPNFEPSAALRRYQLLADCSRDIILCIRAADGRIVDANKAAIEAYGYTYEELLELTIYDLRSSDAPAAVARQMEEAERGSTLFQTVHYRKDGTRFPVEVSAQMAGGEDRVVVSVIRDITVRKQAQTALQESEERLRLATEVAGIGTYDFDVAGGNVRFSRELCDLAGIPEGTTLSPQEVLGFVHPDDLELVSTAADLALGPRGDGYVCVEFRLIRQDGEERVARWTGRTFFADTRSRRQTQRRPVRQVGCLMDITERSRAESEARQWQHAFEKAELAIALGDSVDGTFRAVNPAFARQHGYEVAELIGRPVLSVCAPEQRDRVRALLAGVDRKIGHVVFESVHQRKDGSRFPVLVDLTVERDKSGRRTPRIAYVHDLTGQKRSEALYRAIAGNIPDSAVAVVDLELRYLLVEGTAAARFCMARELMEGRLVEQAHEDGEWRETILEMYRRALRGERLQADRECWGRQVWSQFVPLCDDSGRVVGAMSLFQDITERKGVEEQLRQAQKLESIGLLAGGIAHDFNNLLVGVMGNAGLLHDSLPEESPLRRLALQVVQAGEQAAHLTRQMLAYAGKGQFVLAAVDLSRVVRETTPLVTSSISKKTTLDLRLALKLAKVESDQSQIQQVFMNLAINAAEAIGEGGGTITVTTGEAEIEEGFIRRELPEWPLLPGRCVFLEVGDTGCGMDNETRSRVFDPFYTTKFQGRGLGLAAVAGIVRTHKGAIQVATAPGEGSVFRVLLPALRPRTGSAARPK